ncbi:MAG: hypothetical protein AUK34_14265 [Ignavibacteria bacterium CG2_30_36_16]|nr:hypothetical protein [Ignavibacteria bacterium]OIP54933.1 MAG: hypothetical protein AUK34_14265 [Ignavibacteria bacterium CG2_30_36_16]PJB01328.1 MAG: hypothetical protein CO127_04370 [Ignavibacteria bacterium CG_4_9_14_3_um_filter_36_18]
MELIPILSTIILVATISTFILAIGAYILYKVREARGQQAIAPQAETIRAELVTPAEIQQRQQEPRVMPQPIYIESQQPAVVERQPIFVNQQGRPSPRSTQSRFAQVRPRQYAGSDYVEMRGTARPQSNPETTPSETKFYKYTSEGYVPTKEDKNSGALKWR